MKIAISNHNVVSQLTRACGWSPCFSGVDYDRQLFHRKPHTKKITRLCGKVKRRADILLSFDIDFLSASD